MVFQVREDAVISCNTTNKVVCIKNKQTTLTNPQEYNQFELLDVTVTDKVKVTRCRMNGEGLVNSNTVRSLTLI